MHEKNMNFHVYKFSFLSSNWKVCQSKIGFSVAGQETEFAGDENSWFSHGKSSPAPKEDASHFNKKFTELSNLYIKIISFYGKLIRDRPIEYSKN